MERRVANSECRRRLEERDDHGERLFAMDVWWPVVGSFDDLHPEYEVNDYRDGSRFLDFAYLRPPYRISIEIDGFGTHQRNASRRSFGDDRFRQNQLVLDGWTVVRFAFDDVREKPRQCQQFLQQLLGKLYGLGGSEGLQLKLALRERELLRWAQRRGPLFAFGPKDATALLAVSRCTALKTLYALLDKGLLEQASGGQRLFTYRLTSKAAGLIL
ncbi:DNA-binding response regulator [Paenibacillus sp. IB182493]|uniref:DNA-binding response regulator n=2 Tax=Paenibacillus arenilitoris TaxID=2772299 RepID=A0A927CV00_9BACL|nr:DNA-binding response regulator [Paenibacillus arenilitoris]